MEIIGVQFDVAWEDRERNFREIDRLLGSIAPSPGSWVILPEMFSTGFSFNIAKIEEGETRPGERFLESIARRFNTWAIGGVVTKGPDGRGLNQAVAYAPGGHEAARYTKIHPFSFAGEQKVYASGDRPIVLRSTRLRIAPFVCYDLRFPEAFRACALEETEVFAVIANWPTERIAQWESLLIARAIENQAFVIGVNRVGNDPKLSYPGHSMIVDPRGKVLDRCIGESGFVRAEINLETVREYRASFPALADVHRNLLGDRARVIEAH